MRSVTSEEISKALSFWSIPKIPYNVSAALSLSRDCLSIRNIAWNLSREIRAIQFSEERAQLELAVSSWLYELVRRNIKRGRNFRLRDVLIYQQADCLGYAKLLAWLGRRFALNAGIVEVVVDNAGRYVPHYVNLIKFPFGKRQFVDLWYGSRDIRHHRIGVQVKEGGKWQIKDLDWDDLEKVANIRGLPSKAVDGITHYILGNRHLEGGIRDVNEKEIDKAIKHYTTAINLYPGYARAYFNRAIAYENKGEREKAGLDYIQALRDGASQIRLLAREHEDIIRLMELDRANIGVREQEIYLLHRGFITGKQLTSAQIAKQYGIPESEVDIIILAIEAKISSLPAAA